MEICSRVFLAICVAACGFRVVSAAPPPGYECPIPPESREKAARLRELSMIAGDHMRNGRYAEAAQVSGETTTLAEQLYGEQDWHTREEARAEARVRRVLAMTAAQRQTLEQIQDELSLAVNEALAAGDWAKAVSIQEEICQKASLLFEPSHSSICVIRRELGDIYIHEGKAADKAKEIYQDVLEDMKRVLGERHSQYYATLFRLARACEWLGEYEEATQCYVDLRRLILKADVWDDEWYTWVYLKASETARRAGMLDEAERFCREACDGLAAELPAHRREYLAALFELDVVLCMQGAYGRLAPLHELIWEQLNEPNLPQRDFAHVQMRNCLGEFCSQMEDYPLAVEWYSRAVNFTHVLRNNFFDEWEYIDLRLIGAATKAGNRDIAREYLNDITNAEKTRESPDEDNSVCLAVQWAQYHRIGGDLDACKASLDQARPILPRMKSRIIRAEFVREEALLAAAQGDDQKAVRLFEEAIAGFSRQYGATNLIHAQCAEELADVLVQSGSIDRARAEYNRALGIREKAVGKEHPAYANGLVTMARFRAQQSEIPEAKTSLEEALRVYRASYGERPKDLAAKLNNCAQVYHSLGDKEKADKLQREIADLLEPRDSAPDGNPGSPAIP